jgi:hypothetical protein
MLRFAITSRRSDGDRIEYSLYVRNDNDSPRLVKLVAVCGAREHLPELIRDVAPDGSTYYTAILQNLFFATLNTEMDALGEKPVRRFLDAGDGHSPVLTLQFCNALCS